MATLQPLKGLRVVVVEDEAVLQMALDDMLTAMGCIVAGTAHRLARARDLIGRADFDLAILDVNLAGETVHPVAEALTERGVPFVFATGFGENGIPIHLRDRPIVHKPYTQSELEHGLVAAWQKHRTSGEG